MTIIPFALQNTPALIESVFPAQKVSFESQRERKAGAGQTLTALGSYWKGRKPLILVRAIVLGSLLPPTDNAEKDLGIYEQLLAFDEGGLARRALANNAFKPKDIVQTLTLTNPWHYFAYTIKAGSLIGWADEGSPSFAIDGLRASAHPITPFDADELGITLRWQRDLCETDKLDLYLQMLRNLPNYETRASVCKRPEELDQTELFAPVWAAVNHHYRQLGINAHSHQELVEQLGILRFGHRPKVGDTFCGGGSIPFEAARLGCDVYASDLNPIACMLTWGALNIIGAPPEKRAEIEQAQREVAEVVDAEITALGIEHDSHGNRAKAYLYCLESRCPETGWMVPLSPSWVISKTRNVVAKLIPNPKYQRFDIAIVSGVSAEEMLQAELGTVQNGCLTYSLTGSERSRNDGKTYTTPIKTLRGDYKDANGNTANRLRRWEKHEFKPRPDDIFQERLYCVQWITADSLNKKLKKSFFAAVTDEDLERERLVEKIVAENITQWQQQGLVPDMAIEPGEETTRLRRERGWTYWHHLFNARNLVIASLVKRQLIDFTCLNLLDLINFNAKLCRWTSSPKSSGKTGGRTGGASDNATDVFSNQALNTFYSYAFRSFDGLSECLAPYYHKRGYTFSGSHAPRGNECGRAASCDAGASQTAFPRSAWEREQVRSQEVSGSHAPAWEPSADALASRDAGASQTAFPHGAWERDLREKVRCQECNKLQETCDLWLTDPPYADAVHYHEITEYFIAWLRKNPPTPFNEWVWDSRRALAIKGSGDDFRRGMVEAYTTMTQHMPDNGMQCVMFTHQDTGVWSDMVGIFWAAGLQVVGAWYIATETTSELKKGGYVQGTVILMLRKRPAGDNPGFKQKILPAVRREVEAQIKQMLHLNADVKDKRSTGSLPVAALPTSLWVVGEPVFNDSDLQMAGYAAALKVLTGYTSIGGEDVTAFALRPRQKGQVTVVDEIVQQASEAANSLLIPEGLQPDTWNAVKGIQRFYLRMLDIETTGAAKLDNYQNFAKAFHVEDYTKVMASMAPNKARLKSIEEFSSRDLGDSTEIGPTYLGHLIIALQQLLQDKEPQTVIDYLQNDVINFLEARPLLIDMVDFVAAKTRVPKVNDAAEILSARLRNLRLA